MAKKNYAYVNNEMLVWARSTTPFNSSIDVQEQIKINSEKIDAWESGDDYPSITEAKRLAKLYKVPFATFFLSEAPQIEPRPYTDRRTYNDTVYRETTYELWSEIGRIIGNRENVMDILEEDDDEDIEYEKIPVFGEDDSIEVIGKTIRDFLGVALPFKNKSVYKNPFNYYRSLLEGKGILVSQITGISLEEVKGLSVYYDSFPIIAVNNKDYDRAKTFSLMHELAHLIRRSSSLCLIDFDDRNDEEEKICDSIHHVYPDNIYLCISGLESCTNLNNRFVMTWEVKL